MTTKMQITSDARQKLRKIQNGDVFDSPIVWVTELMQNSYRAKAKNVKFFVKDNMVTVIDDGVGAKSPKSILTLDYSDWESTDEGFGIGFWSVLAIPELSRVIVVSKDWIANINVSSLFTNGYPEADVDTNTTMVSGFGVRLFSPWFRENQNLIINEIRRVGETQPYNVYINDTLVPKRDITEGVTSEYTRRIENNKASAVIGVTTKNWNTPTLYYERREIGHLPALELNGITGIIELKPKALNLKEPDRKAVVKNKKYESFVKMIHDEAVKMYLNFLETATDEKITEYASTIDYVVPVDAYEKILTTDDETCAMTIESEGNNEIETTTEIAFPTSNNIVLTQYEQPNADVVRKIISMPQIQPIQGSIPTLTHLGGDTKKKTLKEIVKATKKKVWIRASELDALAEVKAKAEYYGVKVFVAKNILHEKAFAKWGVSHISAIENGIVKRNIKTGVELKTEKETNFIRLLQPITKKYNLPENTFLIGNLKLIVETNLDGKVIDREVKPVSGVTDGKHIILDRKSLGLKRFHLYGSGFGQHEMKALMANLPTIAHELAHLLYNTTDNTVDHYKTQEQIYDEIVKMYLTL